MHSHCICDICLLNFWSLEYTTKSYKMPNVKAVIWFIYPSFLHFIRYLVHLCCFICERMHLRTYNRHLFEHKLLPAVYMCTLVGIISSCVYCADVYIVQHKNQKHMVNKNISFSHQTWDFSFQCVLPVCIKSEIYDISVISIKRNCLISCSMDPFLHQIPISCRMCVLRVDCDWISDKNPSNVV